MKFRAANCVRGVGVVVLAILASMPSRAQISTATLSGTVTNASGMAVPGAEISIKNLETGQSIRTQTDQGGQYRVLNLSPDDYEVSITVKILKRSSRKSPSPQVRHKP
jgi:Carboxypeptidase regulatory-like domain